MLRVAIAEDNSKDRERLQSFLKQYETEKNTQIEIAEYTDGSKLLEQYRPCYDVIFLDVEMPEMDGMKAAEKIREMDEEVILIFITNMAKYAIRGYQVQALDYVLKPVKYEAFSVKMDKVKRLAEKKKDKSITIKTGTTTHRLQLSHIQYVEVVQHRYDDSSFTAFSYPVCGSGTASADLSHRGWGFFYKRRIEGCRVCS